MVDFGNAKAQYIRLTYTGGQKNGFGGAIWNIKVYGSVEDSSPQQWLGLTAADFDGTTWHNNEGMLAGKFSLLQGTPSESVWLAKMPLPCNRAPSW